MYPYVAGDQIGPFKVIRRFGGEGSSGMGIVYAVTKDGGNGEPSAAVKTLQNRFLASPAMREAFRSEALVWVSLGRHRNIVEAQGVLEWEQRLYILMDYLAPSAAGCQTWADYLTSTQTTMPLEVLLDWTIHACHGLEHAFSHGLVCHRDIKPQNLMVSPDGVVKITDFGIAIALSNMIPDPATPGPGASDRPGASLMSSPNGPFVGTIGYIAPEILTGDRGSQCSDIFSFGVVLYQLVSGSIASPLVGIGAHQTWIQKDAKGLRPIDTPLWLVIQQCLRQNPSERIQTFEEVRLQLERIAQSCGVRTATPAQSDGNSHFWVTRGLSLNTLGQHDQAISWIDRAIADDPRNTTAWSARILTLLQAKRLDEAIAGCEHLIQLNPRLSEPWALKGQALAGLNRSSEAVRSLEHAIELAPEPEHFLALASLHAQQGGWREVIRCCDGGLRAEPTGGSLASKYLLVRKADALSNLSRFSEAVECCNLVLNADLKVVSAWVIKANALRELKRGNEEVECLRNVTQLTPQFSQGWRLLATAESRVGNIEQALNSKLQALRIDPFDETPDFIEDLGRAFEQMERPFEAIEAYDIYLGIVSKRSDVFVRKGTILAKIERYEEAAECFRSALLIDPKQIESLNNLGVVAMKLERVDEAEDCFTKMLAIDPHNGGALSTLASIASRKGDLPKAQGYLDRALRVNPKDDACWLEKGRLFLQVNDYDNALTAYAGILVRDQGNAKALAGAGRAYARLKLWEHARECLGRALGLGEQNVSLWLALAETAEGLGIREGVVDSLRRALVQALREYSGGQLDEILKTLNQLLEEATERMGGSRT